MTAVHAEAGILVDEPGLYDGLTDEQYHGDPVPGGSLSSSGARRLLPPSCPALFKYERENGRGPKRAFDFGHAAHRMVLGFGADIVVAADEEGKPFQDWRTNAAKAIKARAYAQGKTPMLASEMADVKRMAEAINGNAHARSLLDPGRGTPEQSGFWVDERSGVWRRVRYDWLPDTTGHLIIPDYKTAACASPDAFRRSAASFGYHQQAAWYMDAAVALGLAESASFLFIVQEKTPPYIVSVIELDRDAVKAGADANRRALDIYARCSAEDRWPGYHEGVALIDLPPWALSSEETYR